MVGSNRSSSSNSPKAVAMSGLMNEIKSFTWKVDNIAQILDPNSPINSSQSYDFQAGETIGISSIWTVCVKRLTQNSEEVFGIFVKLKERTSANCQPFLVECWVCVIDERDAEHELTRTHIVEVGPGKLIGFEFTGGTTPGFASRPSIISGNFFLRIGLKLYVSKTAPNNTVAEMVKEFQIKSRAQARSDLLTLFENPVPGSGNDIKVITSEGKELIVQKCFLAARNPVFKAMLGSNMLEAQSGVINLPDISAPALQVLLHFFYTGDLRQGWSNSEVLVELTNAAAKYQIKDLLEFLDGALGSVCDLQNVGPLLALSAKLQLKTAEKQLLSFIRRNGLSSAENFLGIVEGLSPAKRAGEKRVHDDDDDDDEDVDKPDSKKSKND